MNKRFLSRILVILAVVLASGCGYTTTGTNYVEKSICIKPIVNGIKIATEGRKYANYQSYPRLIENILNSVVIEHFNSDGRLKVVNHEEGALVLSGTITGYSKDALRYSDNNDIRQQRLRLDVKIKLVDSKGQVVKERDVTGETTFFLTGAGQRSEADAQADLVEDTARRISEVVVEEW